jgi:phenylalanyl-tRNA synthetase beta chain
LVAGFMIDPHDDKLIYKLKSTVESLFKFLSKSYIIEEGECSDWMHPYKSLVIKIKDETEKWKQIGYLGMINPLILENFSIKNPVAYFSFDLDELNKSVSSELQYKAINKYPIIDLDASLLIHKNVKWTDLKKSIKSESSLVQDVEFIEIYEKKEWNKENLHSLTLRVIYQSEDGTLELEEVNKIHEKIKAKLLTEFNCEIR